MKNYWCKLGKKFNNNLSFANKEYLNHGWSTEPFENIFYDSPCGQLGYILKYFFDSYPCNMGNFFCVYDAV